jgi:hypothetical protein
MTDNILKWAQDIATAYDANDGTYTIKSGEVAKAYIALSASTHNERAVPMPVELLEDEELADKLAETIYRATGVCIKTIVLTNALREVRETK